MQSSYCLLPPPLCPVCPHPCCADFVPSYTETDLAVHMACRRKLLLYEGNGPNCGCSCPLVVCTVVKGGHGFGVFFWRRSTILCRLRESLGRLGPTLRRGDHLPCRTLRVVRSIVSWQCVWARFVNARFYTWVTCSADYCLSVFIDCWCSPKYPRPPALDVHLAH